VQAGTGDHILVQVSCDRRLLISLDSNSLTLPSLVSMPVMLAGGLVLENP
jgi:hypothetical protein